MDGSALTNKERARARVDRSEVLRTSELNRSIDSPGLIERILAAKPTDHDPQDIAAVRSRIAGYAAKFHPAGWDGQPTTNPTPPDETIAAQILAMVSLPQFERLIGTLMTRRQQPGYEWSWWVTVVAHRCRGIQPSAIKAARRGLHIARQQHAGLDGEQQDLPIASTDQAITNEAIDRMKRKMRQGQ